MKIQPTMEVKNFLKLEYEKDEPTWQELGRCQEVDPEIFFPEDETSYYDYNAAKKICGTCDVINECLAFAMEKGMYFGIWGGTTPRQRANLRRTIRRNYA